MQTYAILAAAGSGRRFGGLKQFQLLDGKPLFVHPLEVLVASRFIAGISLVVPPEGQNKVQEMIRELGRQKPIQIVEGGSERQDSVRKGFRSLSACELVLVHDGARPFLTQGLIERVLQATQEGDGAVPGLPVKETTKEVSTEGVVTRTIDRSQLWNIQTPQAFHYQILKKAIDCAEQDHFLGTDEAMLVERIGAKVKVISGDPWNMKITTQQDFEIAQFWISSRKVST